MNPRTLPIRGSSRPICQLCDYILHQPSPARRFLTTRTLQTPLQRQLPRLGRVSPILTKHYATQASRKGGKRQAASVNAEVGYSTNAPKPPRVQKQIQKEEVSEVDADSRTRYIEVNDNFRDAESRIKGIMQADAVPDEAAVLGALHPLYIAARAAVELQSSRPAQISPAAIKQSSAASLIGALVDEEPTAPKGLTKAQRELPAPSKMGDLATDLLRHPTVFITSQILNAYVQLCALLRQPTNIPEIFHLYANKPIPVPGSSPIQYSPAKPDSPKSAIPKDIVETALTAAINAKEMGLSIDIIEQSYAKKAHKRQVSLRTATLPTLGVTAAPLLIWELAQWISMFSPVCDPDLIARNAFIMFSCYCLYCGTLGYVTWTTWCDNHDRVRWIPGQALNQRWIREDERAALDRVAQAWGFKETFRRGEEEGEDWEALKDWCYLKGMVLDKSDLLEGME